MEFIDFESVLLNNTKDYSGNFEFVIKRSPQLYRLICDLLIDDQLDKEIRSNLFSAVGYFIIPKDLYSEEEFGPIGYIDDLMLVIFILKKIEDVYGFDRIKESSSLIPSDLERIMNKEFADIINKYPVLFEEVIDFLGF